MQNEMRDWLVRRLNDWGTVEAEALADYLIANGVMLPKLKEPPTDLNGKCGSCIYAKPTTFGKSRVYVECTNVEHLGQWCKKQISYKRQRTHKACKRYQKRSEVTE